MHRSLKLQLEALHASAQRAAKVLLEVNAESIIWTGMMRFD